MKIKLEIEVKPDVTTMLTLDEARELYKTLESLFGDNDKTSDKTTIPDKPNVVGQLTYPSGIGSWGRVGGVPASDNITMGSTA